VSPTVAVSAVSVVIGVLIIPTRSESADQAHDQSAMGNARAPVLEYNAGTTAYRAGQFPQATQSFQQSIKVAPASDAKRLADQEDAYFNLGNALYRAGQQLEKFAPQEAIQKWTEAVKAYDTALQLRANDADSKYNRDFVNRKIDALRKPPDQGGGGGKGQGQGHAQGQPPPQGQPQQPPAQSPKNDSLPPDQHAGRRDEGNHQRQPGQMSAEEARELLDSEKSDEHHSLAVASGPRNPDQASDKAFKNW
jgi:Ca-activated chloride channel family protein